MIRTDYAESQSGKFQSIQFDWKHLKQSLILLTLVDVAFSQLLPAPP